MHLLVNCSFTHSFNWSCFHYWCFFYSMGRRITNHVLIIALIKGSLGSTFAITESLSRATPLIFTGLAAAVAFRAKFWNIGAEGQLYCGAMAATLVGTGMIDLPAPHYDTNVVYCRRHSRLSNFVGASASQNAYESR